MALFTTSEEQHPGARIAAAHRRGVAEKLLFCVGGGLGDQMSAEPALSYALRNYTNVKSAALIAPNPELFTHLPFDEVFRFNGKGTEMGEDKAFPGPNRQPDRRNYLSIHTFLYHNQLGLQFLDANGMNTVDFCCMVALRQMIPHCEREISLPPQAIPHSTYPRGARDVVVHPGKSWPSRTFPTDWWDAVLSWLRILKCRPVLIGTPTMTVPVQTSGCVDMRGTTNLFEYIWLCQQAKVVLTNDSSPVHAASSSDPDFYADSGRAYIGFLATARRPEHVLNWRCGELGWRMQNLAKGGMWELSDYCPNALESYDLCQASEEQVRSWLPEAREVAEWAAARVEENNGTNGPSH